MQTVRVHAEFFSRVDAFITDSSEYSLQVDCLDSDGLEVARKSSGRGDRGCNLLSSFFFDVLVKLVANSFSFHACRHAKKGVPNYISTLQAHNSALSPSEAA